MCTLSNLDSSEGLALFCDGSAWNQDWSGAWAWFVHDAFGGQTQDSGRATEQTTNNRMEIQAWIEGLAAIASVLGPCQVIVYSDSEYVGLGAMNRRRRRHKNTDLWELLDECIDEHLYVEYYHLKGHSGNRIHNIVDRLASDTRRA